MNKNKQAYYRILNCYASLFYKWQHKIKKQYKTHYTLTLVQHTTLETLNRFQANGSRDGNGSVGQWVTVTASDPLTHNDGIAAQYHAIFCSQLTLRNCSVLTHSSILLPSSGLNFDLRFFALKTERLVQYHHATPLPCPMRGEMTMGHGSRKMTLFHL